MLKNTIPLCYHPTKVVLVDDNQEFLFALEKGLEWKGLDCISFTDPKQALDYLNGLPVINKFEAAFKHDQDENTYMTSLSRLTVDMRALYNETHNPERFNDISVVVIDYDMPKLKGDQVAAAITHPYLKKLMLTGHTDYQMAIKLLNEHSIDNFAEKKPLDGIEQIYEKIQKLQESYFKALTRAVADNIFTSDSVIYEPGYQKLISSILRDGNAIEYYLVSNKGTMVFNDAEGKQTWLVIASDSDFDGWEETAVLADAPGDVVSMLSKRTHMLCLFHEADAEAPPSRWKPFLRPVKKVTGEHQNFYYAICQDT